MENKLSKFANEYNQSIAELDQDTPVDIATLLMNSDRIQSNFGRINQKTNLNEIVENLWENQKRWNVLFRTMRYYNVSNEMIRAAELFSFIPDTPRKLLSRYEITKKATFYFCAIFTYCAQNNLISDELIEVIKNHTCNHQKTRLTNNFICEDLLWQMPYLGTIISILDKERKEFTTKNNDLGDVDAQRLNLLQWYILHLFMTGTSGNYVWYISFFEGQAGQNNTPPTDKGRTMDLMKNKRLEIEDLIKKFKKKPEICPDFEKRRKDFIALHNYMKNTVSPNYLDPNLLPLDYQNFFGNFGALFNDFLDEENSEAKKKEWGNLHNEPIINYLKELQNENEKFDEQMRLVRQKKLEDERRARNLKAIFGILFGAGLAGLLFGARWLYYNKIGKK